MEGILVSGSEERTLKIFLLLLQAAATVAAAVEAAAEAACFSQT
jgi:hypothetical protein